VGRDVCVNLTFRWNLIGGTRSDRWHAGWPHRQRVDMEGYDTQMQIAYPELGKIIVPANPRVKIGTVLSRPGTRVGPANFV
jgi:hypothetical protein